MLRRGVARAATQVAAGLRPLLPSSTAGVRASIALFPEPAAVPSPGAFRASQAMFAMSSRPLSSSIDVPAPQKRPILFALVDDDANLADVESLISHGVDVNVYDPATGSTPLLAALGDHAFATARALITAGADVTARDRRTGATTLLAMCDLLAADSPAAEEEVEAMAEALLALGADPTATRTDGTTLMHAAAEVGSRPLVRFAIAAGLSIDDAPPAAAGAHASVDAAAPSAAAAETADAAGATGPDAVAPEAAPATGDGAQAEGKAEGECDGEGEERYPPVCYAVLHPPALAVLLAAGADANARTAHGLSALALALQCRSAEAVRLLLEHGADPNAPQDAAATAEAAAAAVAAAEASGEPLDSDPFVMPPPLYTAIATGADDATVEALLAAGAAPDARSYPGPHGEPALIAAVRRNATAQVRALLAAGADPNAVMVTGTNAPGAPKGPAFPHELLADPSAWSWVAASHTLPRSGGPHTIPVTAVFAVAALPPADVPPMLSLLRAHGADLDVFSVAGTPELAEFDAAAAAHVDRSDPPRYEKLGRAAVQALKKIAGNQSSGPPVVMFALHRAGAQHTVPSAAALAVDSFSSSSSSSTGSISDAFAAAEVAASPRSAADDDAHLSTPFDYRSALGSRTPADAAALVMAFLDAGAAPDARGSASAYTAATAAAYAGNAPLLAELLQRYPLLRELRSSEGGTPLLRAVRSRSRAAITAAVANRVDAAALGRGGFTATTGALFMGDAELFDWLLNRLYVTAETRDAATVCAINALEQLPAAEKLGQDAIERQVLPVIARVLGPYDPRVTPVPGTANAAYVMALHAACERVTMQILRALSALGVPSDVPHPITGATPLMSIVLGRPSAPAIDPGRLAAMHYVLEHHAHANPHATDRHGLNASSYALHGCRVPELHGLLDAGVLPQSSALLTFAQSPPELVKAHRSGAVDSALRRVLALNDAVLFYRAGSGHHATGLAAARRNRSALAALRRLEYSPMPDEEAAARQPMPPTLVEAAPPLAPEDVAVHNRLLRHVNAGDAAALTAAVQATLGVDLGANTPLAAGLLCAAVTRDSGAVVSALLALGANPAAVVGDGGEPLLHLAIRMQRRNAVLALAASRRVDVNARHRGVSPLLIAARAGMIDMITPLVTTFGADAAARTGDGEGVADVLVRHYQRMHLTAETVRTLVDMLCAHGAERPPRFDELVPAADAPAGDAAAGAASAD